MTVTEVGWRSWTGLGAGTVVSTGALDAALPSIAVGDIVMGFQWVRKTVFNSTVGALTGELSAESAVTSFNLSGGDWAFGRVVQDLAVSAGNITTGYTWTLPANAVSGGLTLGVFRSTGSNPPARPAGFSGGATAGLGVFTPGSAHAHISHSDLSLVDRTQFFMGSVFVEDSPLTGTLAPGYHDQGHGETLEYANKSGVVIIDADCSYDVGMVAITIPAPNGFSVQSDWVYTSVIDTGVLFTWDEYVQDAPVAVVEDEPPQIELRLRRLEDDNLPQRVGSHNLAMRSRRGA